MHRSRLAVVTVLMLCAATAAHAQSTTSSARRPSKRDSTIIAQEQAFFDAYAKGDANAANRIVGADFVALDENGVSSYERAKTADMIKGCTFGRWTVNDPKVTWAGPDVAVLTYTARGEATCNGKALPSPMYQMTVWRRRAGHWVAVAHAESKPAQ